MLSVADEYGEENYIAGAHGTIAEQQDEAFYDDRSDASDDMEKGKLNFPSKIYGRERELEVLHKLYDGLSSASNNSGESKIATVAEDVELKSTPDPFIGSRVVFLSGYSGIGKSALVGEFIKQASTYENSQNSSQMFHASGKYTELRTASAPFSAIIEVLEKLALDLSDNRAAKRALHTKVVSNIKESELIGPGTEGNSVLRATFTKLTPLLACPDTSQRRLSRSRRGSRSSVHYSLNAIKESTAELLSVICGCLEHPFVIFLDDLQWADEASIDILSLLLTSKKLSNIMFICAYRSNEVDAEHSFAKLMGNVKKARSIDDGDSEPTHGTMKKIDLFSLSPEAITNFIADSVKKDKDEGGKGVAELAEAVYTKTMGNMFFVKQALEELVRKNILFYDVMCFEWRWVVSKVDLENYMSADVVDTVKGKIRELSVDIQLLLMVMAYIPTSTDISLLTALMSDEETSLEESAVGDLLKEASEEGMIIFSNESKIYVFAHDRIRQASLEFAEETEKDDLLLHIAKVMQAFADKGPCMEWCLYVAVDVLNSLQPGKTDCMDLIRLNVRVSTLAGTSGSIETENKLLRKGLKLLESSGKLWKVYDLTLEMYNLVIKSDYTVGKLLIVVEDYLAYFNSRMLLFGLSTGSRDMANFAISNVIKYAKTNDDKLTAYLYQMLCKCEETSDYSQAAEQGAKILNLYGFSIPTNITKACMLKEEMKLKMALHLGSYSCLTKLPIIEDPIFHLLRETQNFAAISGNSKLSKIVTWKAIQCALKRGMDKHLVLGLAFAAIMIGQENVKTAYEMAHVSVALSERFADDPDTCATVDGLACCVLSLLEPFQSMLEPFYQCHKTLKLAGGNNEGILGSMLSYFENFMASGVEYGPLVESKLLLVEEYARNIDRQSYVTTFQLHHQFALNLRTGVDNPTEFCGKAFHEEDALSEMSEGERKMAIRDSSSMRLQLAFVFADKVGMVQMLTRLQDCPLRDMVVPRLHSRLCFTGLAAFSLSKRNDNDSFWELGKKVS